jgi:hypothetical protein
MQLTFGSVVEFGVVYLLKNKIINAKIQQQPYTMPPKTPKKAPKKTSKKAPKKTPKKAPTKTLKKTPTKAPRVRVKQTPSERLAARKHQRQMAHIYTTIVGVSGAALYLNRKRMQEAAIRALMEDIHKQSPATKAAMQQKRIERKAFMEKYKNKDGKEFLYLEAGNIIDLKNTYNLPYPTVIEVYENLHGNLPEINRELAARAVQ